MAGGSKYYAVRNGRSTGVYDNWSDCKQQVDGYGGNQYKSFSSYREAQDYIARGSQASQTVCGKEQVDGYGGNHSKSFSSYREPHDYSAQGSQAPQTVSGKEGMHTLRFDGASKGNPGKAGAGAVLYNPDGSVARVIKEGVGVGTNNEAEYRAVIRGLKYSQSQGIDRIKVEGDSKLVCKQDEEPPLFTADEIADFERQAMEGTAEGGELDLDDILVEESLPSTSSIRVEPQTHPSMPSEEPQLSARTTPSPTPLFFTRTGKRKL